MRAAFLVGSFPSISETFILSQVTSLIDSGVDVEIFAFSGPGIPAAHADVEKYRLMERVSYFNIPADKPLRARGLIYLMASIFRRDRRVFLRVLKVFLGRELFGRSRVLPFLGVWYLVPPFLNRRFDVIHCHFGPNGIIGMYLKEIFGSMKVVTTFYGFDLSSYLAERGRSVYSELFRKGDVFLPISEYFRDILAGLGCDRKKIIVHPLSVDTGKFSPARGARAEGGAVFLTVGRMVEQKGIEYSIRAFAELSRKHGGIKYIIAGDGPLRTGLEGLVCGLGLKNVEFAGALSHEGISRLYRIADVFVLASVTAASGDTEGTPTVLLEAQACGIPVVSTLHSGIPEIVRDGETGFLAPERDPGFLADKMELLLTDPELRKRMGSAGRRLVVENFDKEKLNLKLIEIYRTAV